MLLDPKIALTEPKMHEALNIWAELSNVDRNELEPELSRSINYSLIIKNAKAALKHSNTEEVVKILKISNLYFSMSDNATAEIAKMALELHKLDFLYKAAENNQDAIDYIDSAIDEQLSQDFKGTFELLKKEPGITNQKIAHIAAAGALRGLLKDNTPTIIFSTNGNVINKTSQEVVKNDDFVTWYEFQERKLNKADRQVTHLPSSKAAIDHFSIKFLKKFPTILEFEGVAAAVAKKAIGVDNLELLEYVTETKLPFNKDKLATLSVGRGNKPMVLWMLQNDYPTEGTLETAIKRGALPLISLLIQNGVDVNSSPNILISAIERKHFNVVKKLIDNNSDCNAQVTNVDITNNPGDDPGNLATTPVTPLGAAILNYHPEIFSLIASNAIFDKRPHASIAGQLVPFANVLQQASHADVIMEHLKMIIEKRKGVSPSTNLQIDTEVELG